MMKTAKKSESILSVVHARLLDKLGILNDIYSKSEEKVDYKKLSKTFRSNFTSSFSNRDLAVQNQGVDIEIITEKNPKKESLLEHRVIAVKYGDRIMGINDLAEASEPILRNLAVQLSQDRKIHDKHGKHKSGKLKIGKGFSLDNNGNLTVKIGFAFNSRIVKIGKVTPISVFEDNITTEIENIRIASQINIDIEANPAKAASALDKHNQDLKQESTNLKNIIKEKRQNHTSLAGRYSSFLQKLSTSLFNQESLTKMCETSTKLVNLVADSELPDLSVKTESELIKEQQSSELEFARQKQEEELAQKKQEAELLRRKAAVNELMELQQKLKNDEVINFNEILTNISGDSAIFSQLKERVKIDISGLNEFIEKFTEVRNFGILSEDNIKQIERYISSKQNHHFNQGVEDLYKLGIDAIAAISSFGGEQELSDQEKIAESKVILLQVKDVLYKLNLALQHNDDYLTLNIRSSLSGLESILLTRAEEIYKVYNQKIYDLPFADSVSSSLQSEMSFLQQVKTYFPALQKTAFEVTALADFASKSGLESDLDSFSKSTKEKLVKHYELGSFSAMSGNILSYANIVKVRDSNNFLNIVLRKAIEHASLDEKKLIIDNILQGDYRFIEQALIENAKLQKNSREFAELTHFAKNLVDNANHIVSASDSELFKLRAELNKSEYFLHAIKTDIIPAFKINSIHSIDLTKSLLALSEHGLETAIKDFDLLLVQILFEEIKVKTIGRIIDNYEKIGTNSVVDLQTEIAHEFKEFLVNLSKKESDILEKINLKPYNLELSNFTNLETIEKLCKQGLSSTSELHKLLKNSNAIAAYIYDNKDVKELLTENLLKSDEQYLQQQIQLRSLAKLLDLTYISNEQQEDLLRQLQSTKNTAGKVSQIKQDINNKTQAEHKLEQRSAVILGLHLGRTAVNLLGSVSNKSKVHILLEDKKTKSMEDVKLKTEGTNMGVILNGLAKGMDALRQLNTQLDEYRDIYQKSIGVVPITERDEDQYEKQKKINGPFKGKTSARIINNYFLLKEEYRELAEIKENWQNFSMPKPDDELFSSHKLLDFEEIRGILNNKLFDLNNLKENHLASYYSAVKIVRVDENGNINKKGKYLGLAANMFKNGMRSNKMIGYVNLKTPEEKQELQQILNFTSNEIRNVYHNNDAFLDGLNGFNFELLHRADDPLKNFITLKQLNSLEKPENVQKLQKIRNRAYLADFASEVDLFNNPNKRNVNNKRKDGFAQQALFSNAKKLLTLNEQQKKLNAYNDELILRASGNLKESLLLIRVAIMRVYNRVNNNSKMSFEEFLEGVQNKTIKLEDKIIDYTAILQEVGLPEYLQPICDYELTKFASYNNRERQEYLYTCYQDIHLSDQVEAEYENIEKLNAKSDLVVKEDALVKKLSSMTPGSYLLVKTTLDIELARVINPLVQKLQESQTFGLASLKPQLKVYQDSAFTLTKLRNGNIALILNKEQGFNLNISLNLCLSAINLAVGDGVGLAEGVKFEFSGDQAEKEAVAFGRKLIEGEEIKAKDLVKAQAVELVNGVYYDASVAAKVTRPSVKDVVFSTSMAVKNSRDMNNIAHNLTLADKMHSFTAPISLFSHAVSAHRETISRNRDFEELTSTVNQIYYINEDTGNLQNMSDLLGGPDCDIFFNSEIMKNTVSYKGFITKHIVEESIALTNELLSSSNESKYLDHLYNLILNEEDKSLLYDKEFLQEIETVMRTAEGEKNIVVTKELKPEILEVANMRINQYITGEIDKNEMQSVVNNLLNDPSNLRVVDIAIDAVKKEGKDEEVKDVKTAINKAVFEKKSAYLHDKERLEIKRFKEITNDFSLMSKLQQAHQDNKAKKGDHQNSNKSYYSH